MTKTTPVLLGMLALTACPSDDVTPQDTEGTSTGEETTTMTPPPMTDTTVDPDSASGTGTSEDSATTAVDPCEGVMCEPGEECIGGSCFACAQPTCEPACDEGQACQCPEDDLCCDVGTCGAPICPLPSVGGNHAPCLDDMGMTSDAPCEGGICVIDDEPASAAVCMVQGCEANCQCPAAPDTGNAVVTCDDILGENEGECYLDCGNDETCPDGMQCLFGFVCLYTDAEPVTIPPYGDCFNAPATASCEVGGCVAAPDAGVCIEPCGNAGDCSPAPATGDAPIACQDITGDGATECILDCSGGETCPDGMVCYQDFVCLWPEIVPPPPGYGPCTVGCSPDEVCIDDNPMGMVDPAWSVCAQDGCADVGECILVPPATGDAVVTCGDPAAIGNNVCYLDCSVAGTVCPDGMECADGTVCSWPTGMELFFDDFEDGDLAGWTLHDEDGLTPAMNVSFVNAAWVASDMVEMGNIPAVSTSWYTPAGIADDWMVTPQIMLGANSSLSWISRSANAGFPDALEVYVSTTGSAVADFTDPPVLVANPEAVAYTPHLVDLAAAGYASENVYIAFRNVGNDGLLLLVDNVGVYDVP